MEGPSPVSAADPRRHDGHGWRLHAVARCMPIFRESTDAGGRCRHRALHGTACCCHCSDANRPQTRAGLFDRQPAGICSWPWVAATPSTRFDRCHRSHLPYGHACLFRLCSSSAPAASCTPWATSSTCVASGACAGAAGDPWTFLCGALARPGSHSCRPSGARTKSSMCAPCRRTRTPARDVLLGGLRRRLVTAF